MSDYQSMTVKELRLIVSEVKAKFEDEFKNMKKKDQMVDFLEHYNDGYFNVTKKSSKKKRSKKTKKGPKRPRNSWIFFSVEMRPEYSERYSSFKDEMDEEYREYRRLLKEGEQDLEKKLAFNAYLLQEMGKVWQRMSESEKQPYIDMASEDKDRYVIEKAKFNDESSDSE